MLLILFELFVPHKYKQSKRAINFAITLSNPYQEIWKQHEKPADFHV